MILLKPPSRETKQRRKGSSVSVVEASDLQSEESPAADQDDDWDELVESIEGIVLTAEADEAAAN